MRAVSIPLYAMVVLLVALAESAIPAEDPASAKFPNSIGMGFLPVNPGTYSNTTWKATITLTRGFLLGACEVTQEQFQKVMGQNPSRFKGDQNPVDSVTWQEAAEFCTKLSERPEEKAAGRVYRLPTAAEWEYACRAGSGTTFPWGAEGETQIGSYAWCRDWYGKKAEGTHPVGKKKPNAWGFYDMLGNVWELCEDTAYPISALAVGVYYGPSKPEGFVDPVGKPGLPTMAVIRGGAWNSDWRSANCVLTTGQKINARDDDIGFRVKCVVGAPKK